MTELTAERLRQLLRYEPSTGKMFWRVSLTRRVKVGQEAGSRATGGYVRVKVFGHTYVRSRLAWLYQTGEWPREEIDHRNNLRADDRWSNLREASRTENNRNKRIRHNNKTGFKGVATNGSGYRAEITVDRARKCLGTFSTPEAAHRAYVRAAKKLHGPFARAA